MSSTKRFAVRAAGALLIPLIIQTTVIAFAPGVVSDSGHPLLLAAASAAVGFLSLWPSAWSVRAAALRATYVVLMFYGVIAWTLLMFAGYFSPRGVGLRWLFGDL